MKKWSLERSAGRVAGSTIELIGEAEVSAPVENGAAVIRAL